MSTPFSSVAPPRSSSLSVPATQNTAPVIKFRCLFTHDMRRKAKRWVDGFLRYHTFNKRVMVYDNTGYFVGDLHWRQDGEIQDGDELELDKGVLIQVCEPMERTETDISALYNKSKGQDSPLRPGEAPISSLRSSAPMRPSLASQQASRSLNDLLGIKKTGPVAQLSSPYEQRHRQRHALSPQESGARAAKRQRTASPERDILPNRPQPTILDISDSPPKENSRNTHLPLHLSRETPVPSGANPTHSTPSVSGHTQNPAPANSSSDGPVNALRLSTQKPRRKLMYQESCLRQAPPKASTTTQVSQTNSQMTLTTKLTGTPKTTVSNPTVIVLDDLDDDQTQAPSKTRQETRPAEASTTSPTQHNTLEPGSKSASTVGKALLSNANSAGHDQPPKTVTTTNAATRQSNPCQPPASHVKPLESAPKPRSTGLRKSFSDPTTINSLHTTPILSASPLSPSTDQNNPDELGPWTSEALDLFDFWPPGRPKPT